MVASTSPLPCLLCVVAEASFQLAHAMVNDKTLPVTSDMRPVSLLQHLQAALLAAVQAIALH